MRGKSLHQGPSAKYKYAQHLVGFGMCCSHLTLQAFYLAVLTGEEHRRERTPQQVLAGNVLALDVGLRTQQR